MPFVVETGSGLAEANAYATEAELEAYAEDRAIAVPRGDIPAALIRAASWLDATYRARSGGVPLRAGQGLHWPVIKPVYGYLPAQIPADFIGAVPREVKRANIEAALYELANPRGLQPVLAPGPVVIRQKVDVLETEYAPPTGATRATPVLTAIDGIMAPILARSSLYSVAAIRA